MDVINVLVVEPDPIRREGLLACLSRESDFKILGSGSNWVEALKTISPPLTVDVLLINVNHSTTAGVRAWAILRSMLPDVNIETLTHGEDEHILELILCAGVTALYRPDTESRVLVKAVRKAACGLLDYDTTLVELIKRVLIQPAEMKEFRIGGLTIDLQVGDVRRWGKRIQLTPREREVLTLLGKGKSNRQIALALQVTESTAAFHVSNILKKLGASSRAEAGIVALMLMQQRRLS